MKIVKEETLWHWFSLFIRLRDSDANGYCKCISCGRIHHYKEMQAGHYISRRAIYLAVKYHEKNVNAQCVYCNMHLKGNGPGYAAGLVRKHGPDVLDELNMLKHNKVSNWKPWYISDLSEGYRHKAHEQADKRGIKI